jgi:hypothetical protein
MIHESAYKVVAFEFPVLLRNKREARYNPEIPALFVENMDD